MERFNNIATLTEADNVLKKAAEVGLLKHNKTISPHLQAEAKAFMKERGDTPTAMSSVFVESYLRSFSCDPVLLRLRSMFVLTFISFSTLLLPQVVFAHRQEQL